MPPSRCCPQKKHSATPISSCAPASIRSLSRPSTRIAQCCDLWTEFHPTNARQSCPTGGAPPTRQYAGECGRTDQRQCWGEQIAERLIQQFDHEPELKARIAQALMEVDHEHRLETAYRFDPALWMQDVLGISPRPWQEKFLRTPRGASILVLTARQVGKTTVAACAMAHTAIFGLDLCPWSRVRRNDKVPNRSARSRKWF